MKSTKPVKYKFVITLGELIRHNGMSGDDQISQHPKLKLSRDVMGGSVGMNVKQIATD